MEPQYTATAEAALPSVWLRDVRPGDIAALAADLRQYDLKVLRDYSTDIDLISALVLAVSIAAGVQTIADARGVIGLVGITADPHDTTAGWPWLAGTNRLGTHGPWLLRNIPRTFATMSKERFLVHRGELPADEPVFIKFVEWCGYALGDEITTPMGATYLQFEGAPQCRG